MRGLIIAVRICLRSMKIRKSSEVIGVYNIEIKCCEPSLEFYFTLLYFILFYLDCTDNRVCSFSPVISDLFFMYIAT